MIVQTPTWYEGYIYVVDNTYAELRKAFYDGEIIQYQDTVTGSWYDFQSEPEWGKFNPMRLKTKSKKPTIKVSN